MKFLFKRTLAIVLVVTAPLWILPALLISTFWNSVLEFEKLFLDR